MFILNLINALNENGFTIRDDHNGSFYYGKGVYDGYFELMVWTDDGVTWKWVEVLPDIDQLEIQAFNGEIKLRGIEGDYFEDIEKINSEIDAWVKSIK